MVLGGPGRSLFALSAEVVGFGGAFVHDTTKPDGMPRKQVEVTRIFASGWRPRVGLREGIERTYRWFLEHVAGSGGRRA